MVRYTHTGALDFLNIKTNQRMKLSHHGKGYFSFHGGTQIYKEETLRFLRIFRVITPSDNRPIDPRNERGSGRGTR